MAWTQVLNQMLNWLTRMLQEPRRLNFPSVLQGDKVVQWEDGSEEEAPTARVGVPGVGSPALIVEVVETKMC